MNDLYIYRVSGLFTCMVIYDRELDMIKKFFWEWPEDVNAYSEGSIFVGKVTRYVELLKGCFVDFEEDKGFLASKNKVLNANEHVIVQVKRTASKMKWALLSSQISVRYGCIIIFKERTPGKKIIAFGNKITRDRSQKIKVWLTPFLIDSHKCIVRSSSLQKGKRMVLFDYRMACIFLFALNSNLEMYGTKEKKPLIKISRENDFLNQEVGRVENIFSNVKMDYKTKQVRLIENLDGKILKRLLTLNDKRVVLSRYGYLFVEKTELGWNIDINSGSSKTNTFNQFQSNVNLMKDVFEQIFLRNINGLIIVDLINLNSRWEKLQLEEKIRRYAMLDSLKIKFIGIDQNYLAVLVRQNIGPSLVGQYSHDVEILLRTLKDKDTAISKEFFNKRLNTKAKLKAFSQLVDGSVTLE